MTTFEAEYKKLNKQQRQAVDHIEGPLLVLAGPGTGKTQLLSARAANILKSTDANPGNILCLTFTEKAATNMKDRMLELIGPEARNIVVKTFHGFGAEVINSYPEYFWSGARLQPAPDVVQREVVEEILLKRPLHDPLTLQFSGQYTQIGQILNDIEQAKKAGLNPKMLGALAAANVAYFEQITPQVQETLNARVSKSSMAAYRQLLDELPDEDYGEMTTPFRPISEIIKSSLQEAIEAAEAADKTKPLSEWKSEWTTSSEGKRVFQDEGRSRRVQALAEVYEAYQEAMHSRGYFDYADMILEVITQLQGSEELRTQVQERFSYLMIDEFQDTNDAQFRMALLIANHPAAEGRPNVMAVGDDDQAIYRFQGAELNNIENFIRAFDETEEIVLLENYRSHQSVLDAASTIAEMIDYRLVDNRPGLDKNIIAQNPDISVGVIEHLSFATWEEQVGGVAEQIKDKSRSSDESIAVIARSHASLEQLSSILHQHGVPIRYERRSNIFEHPVVELVADLAEAVEALAGGQVDRADAMLADIIHHPAWRADTYEAYRLAVSMRRKSGWLDAMRDSSHRPFSQLAKALLELVKRSRELPAAIMVEYLLGLRDIDGYELPVREYYLQEPKDSQYMQALSAVQRLRGLVVDFSKQQQPKLEDFVRFLRLNQRHNIILSDSVDFYTGENGVELMSAHGAKGLEFDHVFIIDGLEKEWQPKNRGGKPPKNLLTMQRHGESSDDYARLMFVAFTRARSNLTISSYQSNREGAQLLPSSYVRHIERRTAEAETPPIELAEQATRWPELSTDDLRHLLTPVLEDYELPVTHLVNFIDIIDGGPAYFLERNLLRLPEEKQAYFAYGSAIHAGLESAHRQTVAGEVDVDTVVEEFARRLKEEQVEPEEEERYREKGERLLRELIDQQRLTFSSVDQPERTLSGIRLDTARIGGKLDVVRDEGEALRIIDYKTGRPPSSLDTTSKSDGPKAYKHRLQLAFYGLLVREADIAKPEQTIIGEMIYLESESSKRFSMEYEVSQAEIARVRKLTEAVYACIQALDFPDISGYSKDLPGIEQFEADLLTKG